MTRKGEDRRTAIIDEGLSLARVEGIEALAIGRLAQRVGMSKSGLFAHFKSKESLQLQVLEAAVEQFVAQVVHPIIAHPRGRPRMVALFDNWLAWNRHPKHPGSCPFLEAATDFDDRPGPLREFIVQSQRDWTNAITRCADICCREGHFRHDLDTAQFAFEAYGLMMAHNLYDRLLGEATAESRTRCSLSALIRRAEAGAANPDQT